MTFASFFSSTRPQRVIPFVTNFDTLREAHLSVSIHSITEKPRARIPHYRPKCSRDSQRPTRRDGAKLVPRRDIHHLLAPCHVLPSGLGATLDQRNLVPICSFPAQFSSVFFGPLMVHLPIVLFEPASGGLSSDNKHRNDGYRNPKCFQ